MLHTGDVRRRSSDIHDNVAFSRVFGKDALTPRTDAVLVEAFLFRAAVSMETHTYLLQ